MRPPSGSSDAREPRNGGEYRQPSQSGRFWRQQALVLELLPHRRRYSELEHGDALVELGHGAAPPDDARDSGMAKWKLNRRGFDRHAVPSANCGDALRAFDELGRRDLVVVVRPRLGVGKDAAVVDPAGNDRDPLLQADGKQLFQSHLVEQPIATAQKEASAVRLP